MIEPTFEHTDAAKDEELVQRIVSRSRIVDVKYVHDGRTMQPSKEKP